MKHETKLTSAEFRGAQETQTVAYSQSPLYQQIYLIIRDRILSGEYPDQSLLPSENELAELFAVSGLRPSGLSMKYPRRDCATEKGARVPV